MESTVQLSEHLSSCLDKIQAHIQLIRRNDTPLRNQLNILEVFSLDPPVITPFVSGSTSRRSSPDLMWVQWRAKSQRSRVDLYFLLPAVLHSSFSPSFIKGDSNHCNRPESVPSRRRRAVFSWVRAHRDVVYVPLKYPSRIIWWGGITLKLPRTLCSLH